MKVFKKIGWFFAYIFVWMTLGINYLSLKSMAKKYKVDPNSVELEKRITKVYKFIKSFLYLKQVTIQKIGKEKIEDKPMLYISNHKDNLDPIVLFKLIYEANTPRPIFVAKIELTLKKYSFILDLIDVIYIDRDNLRQVVEVIEAETKCLKEKDSVVVFPEATRVLDEENFGEFKAATLTPAYEAFISIQPIVIYNSANVLKHPAIDLKHDRNVYVKILNSITPVEFINIDKNFYIKKLQELMFKEYKSLKEEIEKNGKKS